MLEKNLKLYKISLATFLLLFFLLETSFLAAEEILKEIFPSPTREKTEASSNQWFPSGVPSTFFKETETKKEHRKLLQKALEVFTYPEGRIYGSFSTVSVDNKIATYKLSIWTNKNKTSLFSIFHPEAGLQERFRFFENKEYMHIFSLARKKLLVRNLVSDLRSRFEISMQNTPLYFSDLHPKFLMQQYLLITDEFDDIFSELDSVKGKTLPHARRYLYEQIYKKNISNDFKTIVLQSKIAVLHDAEALAEKPLERLQKPFPEAAYYGYLVLYIKEEKIQTLEHFDSNGYFLKSINFHYGNLPIINSEKKESILFPILWEIIEPSQKRITRLKFLKYIPQPIQNYYFSDDYFLGF